MKKKGFTLIELLAVIIILAVVSLIATPIVLNVINDARKSAALSEGNLVLKGINSYCEQIEMKKELGDGLDEEDIDCKKVTTLTSADLSKMVSNLDGNTTIDKITLENGKVKELEIKSNTKEVVYNSTTGKMEVQDDEETEEEEVATITQDYSAIGNVVYYNVTAGAECTATEQAANTETNAGCMKFYVLDNTDANTVDLVLDHSVGSAKLISADDFDFENLGINVADKTVESFYCGEDGNGYKTCTCPAYTYCPEMGPITIINKLNELTSHYKGTKVIGNEYDYTHAATEEENYTYSLSLNGFKARMIMEDEFRTIWDGINWSEECNPDNFSSCRNSNGDSIEWIHNSHLFGPPYYEFVYPLGLLTADVLTSAQVDWNLLSVSSDSGYAYNITPVITLNKGA